MLDFITDTVRSLKRSFGRTVYIYRVDDYVADVTAGVATSSYSVARISKGILLPKHSDRKFVYDISFLKANSSFTEGGFFDADSRELLIDKKDLPFEVDQNGYVLADHIRYKINKSEQVEGRYVLITMTAIEGSKAFEIHMPVSTLELITVGEVA